MTPLVRVDHIGIAVESIADGEPLLELLGAEKLVHKRDDDQGFTWAYYELGNASRLELLEPIDGAESFLTGFLEARGPGLHHVTLEVADIEGTMAVLEEEGVRVIDYTERDGYLEAFVPPSEAAGVLFQLMEYTGDFQVEFGDKAVIGGSRLGE